MADQTTTTLPVPGPGDRSPLEGRGSTTIADKVFERLTRRIALTVPGVVRHRGGGPGPLGSSLPTAGVQRAGDRARVTVTVAAEWTARAHEVAADVRDTVRRDLAEQTGTAVDRVDVTVAALVPDGRRTDRPERRRVE